MLEQSPPNNDSTTASPELNNASPRRSPPPTPPKATSLQGPEEDEKKEVAVSPAQPPSHTLDFSGDYQRYIALPMTDFKLTWKEYSKLTCKDKALFNDFLNHYDKVNKYLADNPQSHDTKTESEIKKELHLAASALKKLNVRSEVTAACCAVLAAAAAAAAAVFLWPAAVVASLGISALSLNITAAAFAVSAITCLGLNAHGVFKNSKYDALQASHRKLKETVDKKFTPNQSTH